MFIYTVKMVINKNTKEEYIKYLEEKHLQDVINTGCFLNASLETDINKNEVIVTYSCESQEMFDKYITQYADKMRQDVIDKFSDSIIKVQRDFCKLN